ncbi:MAG: glycosyltransferase family 2 protein [Clostridia bacterium]|nr:glycosyltransferase family 2 protein [Clostridia bacterium]
MKFSILLPVYNVEEYLEQCLDSILAQKYTDYEVIMVDDGSTDGSAKICDRYAAGHPDNFRVIHKKNEGLISARRVGIKEAKGEFCIFVDSDDFIEDNLLETIDPYLDKEGQTDLLMYSFRYFRNGKKQNRTVVIAPDEKFWQGEGKRELYDKLLFSNMITSIWTKAVRTSLLRDDPTDYTQYYGKNMAEDLLQSLYPLTYARKVGFINRPLYNSRINDVSVSRSFTPATISKKNTNHVYAKVREYLPLWGMDDTETSQRVDARWFNEAMYTFSRYYEEAKGAQQKKEILSFDWNSMIPFKVNKNNRYVGENFLKMYNDIESGDLKFINRYFFKKKLSGLSKKIRRSIVRKS